MEVIPHFCKAKGDDWCYIFIRSPDVISRSFVGEGITCLRINSMSLYKQNFNYYDF